jgi:PPOX class probable F420-dependent enzyme
MADPSLTQFTGQQYLNLETYRRTGQAMPTPVWFVQDTVEGQTVFYARTLNGAGKVKRIQNNPQVRIMPCGSQGEPLGAWVPAQARLATTAEAQRVQQLMDEKYGSALRALQLSEEMRQRGWAVIVIVPQTPPTAPAANAG